MATNEILLVDDEPHILSSLQRLLRPENIKIHLAASGEEGLQVLENENIQVVISDMRMPEMNGAEFLKKVKEKRPEIVRMILSGQSELEAIFEAVNSVQIFKYITKPVNSIELKTAIQAGLGHYRLAEENRKLNLEVLQKNQELESMNKELNSLVMARTKELVTRDKILEFLLNYHPVAESLEFIANTMAGIFPIREFSFYRYRFNILENVVAFTKQNSRGLKSAFPSISAEHIQSIIQEGKRELSSQIAGVGGYYFLCTLQRNKKPLGIVAIFQDENSRLVYEELQSRIQGFLQLIAVALQDHDIEENGISSSINFDYPIDESDY